MVNVIFQVEHEVLTCGLEVREEGHNVPEMTLRAFAPITDWPTGGTGHESDGVVPSEGFVFHV